MKNQVELPGYSATSYYLPKLIKHKSNWEAGIRFGDVVSADVTIPFKAPRIHAETYFGKNFDFAVAEDFGAEISFDFPLTVALGWMPRIALTN